MMRKCHVQAALAMIIAAAMIVALVPPVRAQLSEGQASVGVYGGLKKLVGDHVDQDIVSPLFGAKLGYTIIPALTITLNGGTSTTYIRDSQKSGTSKYTTKLANSPFETTLMPVLADVKINYRPETSLNPYLMWGMGILFWDLKKNGTSVNGTRRNGLFDVGTGVEWFLTENLGLDLGLHYQRILWQEKDMSGLGDKQTGVIQTRAGLAFLFGGNKDTDGDGILDRYDKCKKEAEDMDGYQDTDGCPDPDNDGDGIPDLKDKAPNQAEDMDGFQDDDGAPDLDNDADGILDAKDKAPNQAEDMDGFQDEDGAPDLDNDGDGIPDLKDACPGQAETVNGFDDEDGCPDTKPEIVIQKDAPIVLEGVNFKTGSAQLVPGAKVVLDKVVQTLSDYPKMMVEVSGHTDNAGKRLTNMKLSQRRADAVKAYLVSRGITAGRIKTAGIGPDKPVAPNVTADGRAKNRRIEFIRID
jgi:outer membrane protein OmpA-like peptidoglycan-associated protein/opacity protein-like surface antigen